MKRLPALAMLAVAALVAACSGNVIRAESGNQESEAPSPSPLLRESLTLALLVTVVLAVLAVVAWRLLRKRSR